MNADDAQTVPPGEADPGEDFDSAIGDSEGSTTQSIRSSLLDSLKENGRGYHKYR